MAVILPEGYDLDPDMMMKAGVLSDYYMATRYPDFAGLSDISEETAEEAYRWSLEIASFISTIHKDEDGKITFLER